MRIGNLILPVLGSLLIALCGDSSGAFAQGGSVIPTDPSLNQINWAASREGATISTTCSIPFGDFPVTKLIDSLGSDFSRYITCSISGGQSVTLDLGQERSFHTIMLHLYDGDDRFFRYRVETSLNGTDYSLLIDRTSGEHRGAQRIEVPPHTARYVKITGTHSSSNNNFHLINELLLIGTADTTPQEPQLVTIDAVQNGGSSFTVGQLVRLNAGIHRIENVSGALSPYGSDSSNGGITWQVSTNIYVPLFFKSYQYGFTQNRLSRYATAAQAEVANQGKYIFVYLPAEADVYLYFGDSNPSDNRGAHTVRIVQVSGPNDTLLSRVRDAMTRSVLWQQNEVAHWQSWISNPTSRYCYGCHTQSQAMVGLHASKQKLPELPVDQVFETDAAAAFLSWQNVAGFVSPHHGNDYRVSQTSLWAWALASNEGPLYETVSGGLINALNWLRGRQQANGGWNYDHGSTPLYADGQPSAAHTTGNIQALAKVISTMAGESFQPFPDVSISNGQVELTTNRGNIHDVLISPTLDVTALRIRIDRSFMPSGNFVLSELEVFRNDGAVAIAASQANFSQSGYPVAESHNGVRFDIADGWAYSPRSVETDPAVALWVLSDVSDLDRLRLTMVYPNHQLKRYVLEYTSDPSPTLSSNFQPLPLLQVGEFVTAPGSTADLFRTSLRQAAELYLGATWNYQRNTRTAAQTVIGLHTALPYLENERAAAAVTRLTEIETYLRSRQRDDGGWADTGSGVGRVYPSAMALRALLLLSPTDLDDGLARGAEFLLRTQDNEGAWRSPPIETKLSVTTWVEIALPTLFEVLTQVYQTNIITDVVAFGLSGSTEVSWTPIAQATGYNLYRRTADTQWVRIATNHQSSIANFIDQNVVNEATYLYKVRWLNAAGLESADSNEASATPYGMECEGDSPPIITSGAPIGAVQDATYRYQVEAYDPDPGDTLTYSLVNHPAGMQISSLSGLVEWTPNASNVGSNLVRIKVTDRIGRFATQAYQLVVAPIFFNYPPLFVTDGPSSAVTGQELIYNSRAVDPNTADVLTYSIVSAPPGASINPTIGRFRWTPSSGQAGSQFGVTLRVVDNAGASDEQEFLISVSENQPPTIDSTPGLRAPRLRAYHYDVEATDPEQSALTFSLLERPTGMSIVPSSGFITWIPTEAQIGSHPVTVQVRDAGGLTDTQSFTLEVPANEPPIFTSQPVTIAVAQSNYQYSAEAYDPDSTDLTFSVLSGPPGLSIGAGSGLVNWTPDVSQVGTHPVTLRVVDSGNLDAEQSFEVEVLPPGSGGGGGADIEVVIHAPTPGAEIETATDIYASIVSTTGPPPDSWTAELVAEGSDAVYPVASGTGALVNGLLGTIDPSVLANDSYRLTIHVVRGTTSTLRWFPYTINSRRKLGEYSITVSDVSIPLAGLSLDIQRRYSTLDRSTGEFGAGWRLAVPGKVVDSAPESPSLPFTGNTRVFVTRPDGTRVGFTFTPYVYSFLLPFWAPSFTPDPGVTDTLEVDPTLLFNVGGSFYELFNEFNPSRYYLTTRDRVRYTIDEGVGLREVRDANFNTLTFTNGFIAHSSGAALTIERDASNRITRIVDLNGAQVVYTYDAAGDLISVRNQSGEVTSYTYWTPHLLRTVTLHTGQQVLENFYSSDGRLIRQVDGEGNETNIGINLAEGTEVITDRRGFITTNRYDLDGNLIERTLPDGARWQWQYDQNFNQTLEVDPLGNTTSRVYDAQSRLLSETDALGNTNSYTYNSWGQKTSHTNPLGVTATWIYDARGNLISETDFSGRARTSVFSTSGNLLSVTDRGGATSTFAYDSSGRPVASTDSLGVNQSLSYDSNGNLISQSVTRTDGAGAPQVVSTTTQYDQQNRVTAITNAVGRTSTIEYNVYGEFSRVVDYNGNQRLFEYDSLGRQTRILYPDGSDERTEYDGEGNITRFIDRMGRETRYEYDQNGRQTKIIHPDLSESTTTYDAVGRVVSETDTRGAITTYQYDVLGRKIRTIDPLGHETSYTYDALGNQLTITDALGRTTQYQYDAESRVVLTIHPDGTTQSIAYDAEGREIARTDELGNSTSYQYDLKGQLTAVVDALGGVTQYRYDEVGNKIEQIDALGRVTKFEYDNQSRLTRKVLPLGQFESLSYDGNGNVLTRRDFNGAVVSHTYDSNNRLIQKTYPSGSPVTYTYFADGNRHTVTDARGVTTYAYQSRGWLSSVTSPEGQIAYTYDTEGNRLSVSTPSGVTSHSYDLLGRIAETSESALGNAAYGYDAVGNQTTVSYPNGVVTETVFNQKNQPLSVTTRLGGNELQRFSYSLDAAGNRLSITELNGRVSAYTYDALYRLVQETITAGTVTTTSYTYDAVGNRLSQNSDGVVTVYSYDANDRLLSAGAESFSYDNNGNTLSKGSETYSWDFDDRLVGFSKPGVTASYTYDPDGLRVARTVNGALTRQLVDHNQSYAQVLEERDGSGALQTRYTYGADLLAQTRSGAESFYHYDALGSTRGLTDPSGGLTDSYTYRAFGEMLEQSGGTTNNYRFTGEQYAPEADAYYLRARWMKPGLGRFLSRDKFEFEITYTRELAPYSYAANSPISWIDPTGNSLQGYINLIRTNSVVAGSAAAGLGRVIYFVQQYAAAHLNWTSQRLYGLYNAVDRGVRTVGQHGRLRLWNTELRGGAEAARYFFQRLTGQVGSNSVTLADGRLVTLRGSQGGLPTVEIIDKAHKIQEKIRFLDGFN